MYTVADKIIYRVELAIHKEVSYQSLRAAAQREKQQIMKTWLEDDSDRSYNMWNGTIVMTLMSIITG